MKLTQFTSASLALLGISSLLPAQAVNIAWIAGKSGPWETATSWQTNEIPPVKRLPKNGDTLRPGADGSTITYSATSGTTNLSGSSLFQYGGVPVTTILQTGGNLRLRNLYLSSPKTDTSTNYTMSGGVLDLSNLIMSWNNTSSIDSRFVQLAGSVNISGNLNMSIKSSTQIARYDLLGGDLEASRINMGVGSANSTNVITQSAGTTALIKNMLIMGARAGTTGRAVYNLDGGKLTIENATDPFVFTQPGGPVYFDFDGGVVNLQGTWNFASLTTISNSDFRVQGKAATASTLTFKAVTIGGVGFTRISSCEASATNYGTGLAGKNGIPTLTASAAPKFGTKITVTGSNSSGATATGLVLLGVSPFSLDFLGGKLLVAPLVQTYLSMPAGGLVLPFTVPSGPCQTLYLQVLQLDAAATHGVSMSPGLRLDLGN